MTSPILDNDPLTVIFTKLGEPWTTAQVCKKWQAIQKIVNRSLYVQMNQEISIPLDQTVAFDPCIRPLIHLFSQISGGEKAPLSYELIDFFEQIPVDQKFFSKDDVKKLSLFEKTQQFSLWASPTQITKIQILDLRPLKTLPPQIKQFNQLKCVTLNADQLETFLPLMTHLPLLQIKIDTDDAPTSIWQRTLAAVLPNLSMLNNIHLLSNNQTIAIYNPREITSLA